MSKNARPGVLCAGRLYCDLIFTGLPKMPTLGEEVYAGGLAIHPGGGGYITAAYLAALGRPASLLARMPGGPFGKAIQSELSKSGVDLTHCEYDCGEVAQVTAAMSVAGERAFLTHRSGPALPEWYGSGFANTQTGHLHIGELATLIEHPEILNNARASGLTVSLDSAWDEEKLSDSQARAIIDRVDVFLPNEREASLLGMETPGSPQAPLIVIKGGANGARAITVDGICNAPAHRADVVDTTGAGDAFNAGFLHAWLAGCDLTSCLETGNACGAVAVGRYGGATGLPVMTDLLRSSLVS